jgi:predicted N-acetyltransferase YhbS
MNIEIRLATNYDIPEIEKIHLKHFAEIGEKDGSIQGIMERTDMLNLVAVAETGEIVGYSLSSNIQKYSYLQWIGVKYEKEGIGNSILQNYLKECKKMEINHVGITTRNRFKAAIIMYLKNDFEITGVYQGIDGDLMITIRKDLKK